MPFCMREDGVVGGVSRTHCVAAQYGPNGGLGTRAPRHLRTDVIRSTDPHRLSYVEKPFVLGDESVRGVPDRPGTASPALPSCRRQYVTVTKCPAAQGHSDTRLAGISSAGGPTARNACGDACRSTRDGRNPRIACAPACPGYSAGIASAYRSCGCSGNHRTWRGDHSSGMAAMRGGRGRRSDQSATRAIVRSGSTPARTNSS